MGEPKKQTVSTVGLVMAVTLLGKLMGLWRDRLLAISYGTGMEANAFYTASRIPRVFFDTIFASAIAACLIPVFSRSLQEEGEEKAQSFAGNFISVLGLFSAGLTLLGVALAPQMVQLFAGGYDQATQDLAVHLTRIMLPTAFFTGLAFSFVGILQAKERFFMPAFMSCVSNIILILYFYCLDESYGIYGLAVAFLVGWMAQALIQIPDLKAVGFRYKANFSAKTPEMKQVLRLMAPVMVSTWVQPINLTINSRFASHLYEGAGVSMIEIATNLYLIIAGVFILSITNVIFPRLTKLSVEGQSEDFRNTLRETLRISLFFTLPMTAGLVVVAEPLVGLLYGGGEFDETAITHTAAALRWITLGMAGYGVQNIITRGFFAKEDGKTPLVAGLCTIGTNLILCAVLVDVLAVEGLAMASGISSTVYGLVMLLMLQKKEGGILTKEFLLDLGKMICVSVSMVFWADLLLQSALVYGKIIALACTAFVGILGYGILCALLQIKEMKTIIQFIRKRG